MRTKVIKVPIYNVTVTVIQIESPYDAPKIKKYGKRLYIPDEDINKTVNKVVNKHYNGGEIFYNEESANYYIILLPHTCKSQLLNTLTHEKRHVEDFIVKRCALVDDGEAIAYLSGYLGEQMLTELIVDNV